VVFSLTRYFVHSLPPGFTTRSGTCVDHIYTVLSLSKMGGAGD
jgi:hypothetical protein